MPSERKKDHIELTEVSQTDSFIRDKRFDYEPLINKHPDEASEPFSFLGKTMRTPIWISSMTGGTDESLNININLAKAAKEFGMGMGLGSCRIFLEQNKNPEHFFLREIIGDEVPFYANLGIGQIEKAILNNQIESIKQMMDKLKVDGLIIHVNPLQEWLQPEGDRIREKPIEIIREFINHSSCRVIVKEVGQGFGPASLTELLKLPLQAIEFAAFGGTNFSKLELLRNDSLKKEFLGPIQFVGNDANEMLETINHFVENNGSSQVKELIISGGIKTFLDGYYFMQKSKLPAIYGHASMFLKYARQDYETLKEFVQYQIQGLKLANSFLRIKNL